MTGQSGEENTRLAIAQIEQTFEASSRIKVGQTKLDQYGNEVVGVTAVAVKEILPLQHAQLLKLCVVVNDDELNKDTINAGSVTNGHLMHSFVDDEGDTRQAYYSCKAAETLPEEIACSIGTKRSREQAFGMQVSHVRDYA
jgi:hypothetical protein